MSDLLRIVFMGTAELAATVLRSLVRDSRWTVVSAVSQPDKPRGRDLVLQPTPVKLCALEWGLPVDQPQKARNPEFLERLKKLAPDLIVVAAYGQLLPQELLDVPRYGCLNIHTSLLPRYRGAAPIQWAIVDGLIETGVTLMKMDAGLDTGPIVTTARTLILDTDTGQTLHDRLAEMGGRLLISGLPEYVAGTLVPRLQPMEGATVARKITREDGRIRWERSSVETWRRLRAFTPWPGAFCEVSGGSRSRILKVHTAHPVEGEGEPGRVLGSGRGRLVVGCGTGALELTEVQIEGGKRMGAASFLAGNPIEILT